MESPIFREVLLAYAPRPDVIVFALPRRGVPVACEVARALGAPSDVFLAGKLGLPGHEELAIGALATGGVRALNDLKSTMIPDYVTDAIAALELQKLEPCGG